MTGLLLFGGFALCLLLGVPVAMGLGAATMGAILFSPDFSITTAVIPQRIFGGLESSSLMAIAFFVLAGNLMTKGGISRRLVDLANSMVGGLRGGMSLALILSCAFFAALSGSAPATVIAIGSMLYADMVRIGYPKDRTAGLLVVSGGLGPIIPPSIIMVVYCTMTGASVGDMFKSGMSIGVMIVLALMMVVLIYAQKEKWPKAEQRISFKEFCVNFIKAVQVMKDQPGTGKIINIGSMVSWFGGTDVAAYTASKGAVTQLTKSIASDCAKYDICCNAIAPGYMDTEMCANMTQARKDECSARIPAGRWGLPEDLKGPVLFLSSDASNYVNGVIIPVDGGYLVK